MIARFLHIIHDLFFPNTCIICDNHLFANEKFICPKCDSESNWIPSSNDNLVYLKERFFGKFSFEYLIGLMTYDHDENSKILIHHLKYKNLPKIGELFSDKTIELYDNHPIFQQADYLIKIPLHPDKLKKRGYNQLDGFTKKISQHFDIPILENHIIRTKNTMAQALRNKKERLKNKDLFEIKNKIDLNGKHVIVIDDVVTTGTTLTHFVNVLQSENDCKVSILCMAVAK
ncbi:ComF family protein [Capnocytophaga sp. ARDL2]|uniref:ComF family protein n=1 Tax=Capnocytophaga sp. ARDL2 TaxID=3238809 RepID=UPI003556A797